MNFDKLSAIFFSILQSRMKGISLSICETTLAMVISSVCEVFKSEDSLLKLSGDFVVVGDIHGNLDDLLRIFEKHGYPPISRYLFLGDFIDRGSSSLEVIIALYLLKLMFPQSVYLLRGNHECESISSVYGFKEECLKKSTPFIYRSFISSFMFLPFAATINGKYFCVHGGLSPSLQNINEIDKFGRPFVTSNNVMLNDLVWSDPMQNCENFVPSDRGSGYFFGQRNLDDFLKANNLDLMIRSHESCMDGFYFSLEKCLTIFSNTNYCGIKNNAAIVIIKENENLEISTIKFLNEEEMKKRRILVPEWIFIDVRKSMLSIMSLEYLFNENPQVPVII